MVAPEQKAMRDKHGKRRRWRRQVLPSDDYASAAPLHRPLPSPIRRQRRSGLPTLMVSILMMSTKNEHHTIPLGVLLKHELENQRTEKLDITYAAIYSKENLVKKIMGAIPSALSILEWIAALSRALVSGFVKTDKDFHKVLCQQWVIPTKQVDDQSKFPAFAAFLSSRTW
ncbi:hypothetical protein HHK36_015939 [Tetracentron sinense]|uniref:Uncharacterized protein n=1 Tax=Tetracentron sinense TaxID=13715 RepID=A0A834Z362_TETSI|nr:hypothetical protein HHK36_015939 [Tetracentron sinense]